jgi:hypothetical protein
VQQVIYRAKETYQERERQRQGAAFAEHQRPSSTTAPAAASPAAELERLWQLVQTGAISQAEYESLKTRLLS